VIELYPRVWRLGILKDPIFSKAIAELLKDPVILLNMRDALDRLEILVAKCALKEYEEILKDVEAVLDEVRCNYEWCKKKYGWWRHAERDTDLCRA